MAEGDLLLRSARIYLRPLQLSDAESIAAIGGDERVARNLMSVKSPWPLQDAIQWILASLWRGSTPFRLAICLPDDTLIGAAGIGAPPFSCAYFLAPDHWGQGYATEAMDRLLRFGFDNLAMDTAVADHFDDNPGSGRVLRKLGFVLAYHSTGVSAARLEPAPNTHYRLTRQAFEARHEIPRPL